MFDVSVFVVSLTEQLLFYFNLSLFVSDYDRKINESNHVFTVKNTDNLIFCVIYL